MSSSSGSSIPNTNFNNTGPPETSSTSVRKTKCCVMGCNNLYLSNCNFFTVPLNDDQRRQDFLKFTGDRYILKNRNKKMMMNLKICEDHFEDKYITRSSPLPSPVLSENALPTLNGPSVSPYSNNEVPVESDPNILLSKSFSIAVPGSILDNKTADVSNFITCMIARAAATYGVDEIIVFDYCENQNTLSCKLLADLLKHKECQKCSSRPKDEKLIRYCGCEVKRFSRNYKVRTAGCLREVFTINSYNLAIGVSLITSKCGSLESLSYKKKNLKVLVVFCDEANLIVATRADPSLIGVENVSFLFDLYLNPCPRKTSFTIIDIVSLTLDKITTKIIKC